MKRGRKRWMVTTIICAVITLFTGFIPNISAGEIRGRRDALPLTENEINVLVTQEKESSDIHTVSSGENDGLAIIGGVFLVLILLAAVASSNKTSS